MCVKWAQPVSHPRTPSSHFSYPSFGPWWWWFDGGSHQPSSLEQHSRLNQSLLVWKVLPAQGWGGWDSQHPETTSHRSPTGWPQPQGARNSGPTGAQIPQWGQAGGDPLCLVFFPNSSLHQFLFSQEHSIKKPLPQESVFQGLLLSPVCV
jgi:hypothetical protein